MHVVAPLPRRSLERVSEQKVVGVAAADEVQVARGPPVVGVDAVQQGDHRRCGLPVYSGHGDLAAVAEMVRDRLIPD
jgi:hypothetical protein